MADGWHIEGFEPECDNPNKCPHNITFDPEKCLGCECEYYYDKQYG